MLRRLTLMRHAKSSWDDPALDDFDRPLSERGIRDAPLIGAWLRQHGIRPDLILCSSAKRTRATLAALRLEATAGATIRHTKSLYMVDGERLLSRIQDVDSRVGHLMIVGHNPGLEELAGRLIGQGPDALRAAIASKVPTAAVIDMRVDVDAWRELSPGCAVLLDFMTPKRLATLAG